MAVYVDDMRASLGRMKMCHMIADSTEELLVMARNIGVAEKWIQNRDSRREHFDICMAMRERALLQGAIAITQKELARKLRRL